MVAASASVDELGRSVEDGLQSVHLLIRNSRKKCILIVASQKNERAHQRLDGFNREGTTNRLESGRS